jgi:hypothetical protein
MRRCAQVAGLWLLLWVVGVTAAETPQPLEVLHDGEALKLVFAAPVGREKPLTVGPWKLGPSLKRVKNGKPERPSDKRLTLYFIAPGTQYQNPVAPALDHNLLVNTAPANDDPITAEFDLFWVIVLDPDLTKDLRTEQDLIMRAQEEFTPGDLYTLDDAPGAGLLRDALRADSLLDLQRYRHKDGTLPRILILPANSIQSATIER